MGLVLSFTPRVAATHSRNPTAGQAAVIIFPGVRYERTADAHNSHSIAGAAASVVSAAAPAKPTH